MEREVTLEEGGYNPGGERKKNPLDKNGEVSRCSICGSIFHWARFCPDSYEAKEDRGTNAEQVKETLIEGAMDVLIGETLNMAILDSGCSKTVCGNTWMNCYLDTLSEEDKKLVKEEKSDTIFKFGDSKTICSMKRMTIPTEIAGKSVNLQTDVISYNLPLLLSKEAMKKANTFIDFANDKISILGNEVDVQFSSSGHYYIAIGRLNSSNEATKRNLDKSLTLYCGDIHGKSNEEKEKIAVKLHRQFSHPSSDRLKSLLKDANMKDIELFKKIEQLNESCKICKKYRKPKPRPVVGFPMAKHFNETVAMDLKEWSYSPKIWFLHLIDHATRYSASCIIYTKKKEEIVKKIFSLWISVFGTAEKFLVDNGGEFNNEEFRTLCENLTESPWSNGVVEKHNAVLGFTVTKMMDDLKCDLNLAVSWSISAKNSLKNVNGYSPNQLVFGRNPNFPSNLINKPPALEGETTSETVANNLNMMHSARQAFIESESAEKIRRALRHQTRSSGDTKFCTGDIVFYKRNLSKKWKGPGSVIGQDGQQVIVKHCGTYVRVHPCRLLLEKECEQLDTHSEDQIVADNERSINVTNKVVNFDDVDENDDKDVTNTDSDENDNNEEATAPDDDDESNHSSSADDDRNSKPTNTEDKLHEDETMDGESTENLTEMDDLQLEDVKTFIGIEIAKNQTIC